MALVTPILIVIAAWWIGTGVVLYLQQRIESARTVLMGALFSVSTLSLAAMVMASNGIEPWQSYLGFGAAICLWGCIELSYYTGIISGVHKRPCPADCPIGKRFRFALGASLWHEVSVLFAGGVVMTLMLDSVNPAGLYTFLVLWLMRWSAKLNLFFGVPNFNTDWFPQRLAYAHSYIRRSPVTLFFPISVLIAGTLAAQLITSSLGQPEAQALTTLLPGVLLLLAILEHLFMALPIADSALWDRIFTRHSEQDSAPSDEQAIDIELLATDRVSAKSHARVIKALKPEYR